MGFFSFVKKIQYKHPALFEVNCESDTHFVIAHSISPNKQGSALLAWNFSIEKKRVRHKINKTRNMFADRKVDRSCGFACIEERWLMR